MDAIFDDMIGDDGGNLKETIPVNTVAIENMVVNPRFEGGPHIKVNIFPEVHVNSQKKQNLVNFNELAAVVGNVRETIETLRLEFQ